VFVETFEMFIYIYRKIGTGSRKIGTGVLVDFEQQFIPALALVLKRFV